MAVNVSWWNEHFSSRYRSLGLTEGEAERVFLRSPIANTCTRFEELLTEIAMANPERHSQILELIRIRMSKELEQG